MVKTGSETCGFVATPKELAIIDSLQKRYYTKSKSEIIRMLINAGAEKILAEAKKAK